MLAIMLMGGAGRPLCAASVDEFNMIANPGFEDVATVDAKTLKVIVEKKRWHFEGRLLPRRWDLGWHGQHSFFMVADRARTGKYCAKIWPEPGWKRALAWLCAEKVHVETPPIAVKAGVWARGKGKAAIGLCLYSKRKNVGSKRSTWFILTSRWQRYEAEIEIDDERARWIMPVLVSLPDGEKSVFYYDDARLEMTRW